VICADENKYLPFNAHYYASLCDQKVGRPAFWIKGVTEKDAQRLRLAVPFFVDQFGYQRMPYAALYLILSSVIRTGPGRTTYRS